MSLVKWLRQAPLAGYLALTFAWSWACWGLSPTIEPQLPWLAMLLMFAGSFGPSLAAIMVVAITSKWPGLRAWLARCLRWRIGWGWWTFGLLVPMGALLGSDPLPILFDGHFPVRGDRIGSP